MMDKRINVRLILLSNCTSKNVNAKKIMLTKKEIKTKYLKGKQVV